VKRSEEREQNIRRVIHTAQTLFIADGIAATPISRIAGGRPDADVAVPLFPQQGRARVCRLARRIGYVFY